MKKPPETGKGPRRMRMQSVHLAITGFCALVSVILAGVQTFRSEPEKAPVAVQVVVPEANVASAPAQTETVNSDAKADNVTEVARTEDFQLAAVLSEARFQPATRPDVLERYALRDLFDSNPTTLLTIAAPDTDLDFIVELPLADEAKVTGIEISAPEGIPANAYAATLEVMVLPDGTMEGSGRDVASFTLVSGSPVQLFELKPSLGRALWIRIGGQPGASATIIGDIRVLTSIVN